MHQRAASLYRRIQVESAPPPRLLLEALRRLTEDVQLAKECIATGDIAGKARAVDHALALLGQLEASLDHAAAPELCRNLEACYGFCRDRLLLASAALDPGLLLAVDQVIGPIREGFLAVLDKPVVVPPRPEP